MPDWNDELDVTAFGADDAEAEEARIRHEELMALLEADVIPANALPLFDAEAL